MSNQFYMHFLLLQYDELVVKLVECGCKEEAIMRHEIEGLVVLCNIRMNVVPSPFCFLHEEMVVSNQSQCNDQRPGYQVVPAVAEAC